LDDLRTGYADNVRWGPLERGDVGDRPFVTEILRRHRIDGVLHFAASAYVGDSMREPLDYFRNNVGGTLSLLEAMRDAGVATIVFSSSCATYGIPECLPITEAAPQRPVNPYGETKLAVERMLGWAAVAHDLRWISLRYFNAAGADPEGHLGEAHEPERHVIPLAIAAALGGRPLAVFGEDYPTADGTAIRDYIHVSDLADAHIRALDRVGAGGASGGLNLGTGVGHSVRQVIEAVERATGRPVPFAIAPRRAGDPPGLVADASAAAAALGWRPRFARLDEIVDTAVRWERTRL
jgi:UDP-glucose-4-epimerase GalE